MDNPAISEAPVEPVEQPQPADDGGSLAEHEAAFQPDAPRASTARLDETDPDAEPEKAADRDTSGRFTKHRAQSQKATPEDVTEINRLTAELRTKEAEWKTRNPTAADDSPRIKVLKRQIRALDADMAPAPAAKPTEPRVSEPKPAEKPVAATFAEAEPEFKDFETEADPLKAYFKAIAAWTGRKERFEEQAKATAGQADAKEREAISAYAKRVDTFKASKADFDTVTADLRERWLPPVLLQSIVLDDKAAEFMYYLGQHPDAVDELVLMTDGKQPTDAIVATVRRRLGSYVKGTPVVPTGSTAPPARPYNPPKPPNPVRTGPNRSADDLPGEDASLAEHERAFARRR